MLSYRQYGHSHRVTSFIVVLYGIFNQINFHDKYPITTNLAGLVFIYLLD
jgi:hypothetical protein